VLRNSDRSPKFPIWCLAIAWPFDATSQVSSTLTTSASRLRSVDCGTSVASAKLIAASDVFVVRNSYEKTVPQKFFLTSFVRFSSNAFVWSCNKAIKFLLSRSVAIDRGFYPSVGARFGCRIVSGPLPGAVVSSLFERFSIQNTNSVWIYGG